MKQEIEKRQAQKGLAVATRHPAIPKPVEPAQQNTSEHRTPPYNSASSPSGTPPRTRSQSIAPANNTPPTLKNSFDLPPPSPTFCCTCVNNQNVIHNAITMYDLPPADHPEYSHRLNTFLRFKEKEEARYPPVSAKCVPKEYQRFRTSNYQVTVASFGQMLV
ncbi:hypothetical protein RUND412_008661 [Rhizina undulata]